MCHVKSMQRDYVIIILNIFTIETSAIFNFESRSNSTYSNALSMKQF